MLKNRETLKQSFDLFECYIFSLQHSLQVGPSCDTSPSTRMNSKPGGHLKSHGLMKEHKPLHSNFGSLDDGGNESPPAFAKAKIAISRNKLIQKAFCMTYQFAYRKIN